MAIQHGPSRRPSFELGAHLQTRRELMLQAQAFAAASVPTLRPAIRQSFIDVMGDIRRLLGGDPDEAALFTARGMLLNILAALEVPDDFWPTPLAEGKAETLGGLAEHSGPRDHRHRGAFAPRTHYPLIFFSPAY